MPSPRSFTRKLRSNTSSTTVTEFRAEDWDFSKCPTSEIHVCKIYEYAREPEAQALQAKIAGWRETGFDGFDQHPGPEGDFELYWQKNFFRLFPEFPNTPWLNLRQADVTDRLRTIKDLKPILIRTVPATVFTSNAEEVVDGSCQSNPAPLSGNQRHPRVDLQASSDHGYMRDSLHSTLRLATEESYFAPLW